MYSILLILHSLTRWLILLFTTYSIYRAFVGYTRSRTFSNRDDAFRHWTATIAHVQLMIGMVLYTKSPVVSHYWSAPVENTQNSELSFYNVIHPAFMLAAILMLTVGSAMAKRKKTDREKFKTMLVYFSIALLIIFIAIPWPFSPFSDRPLLRIF